MLQRQMMPGICHCDSWNLFKKVPVTNLYSFVIIWSATTVIFQIWTNVARRNVTLTNITVTFEICAKMSQEACF